MGLRRTKVDEDADVAQALVSALGGHRHECRCWAGVSGRNRAGVSPCKGQAFPPANPTRYRA